MIAAEPMQCEFYSIVRVLLACSGETLLVCE